MNADKQSQEYFERLKHIIEPRLVATMNYKSVEIVKTFKLAFESIIQLHFIMADDEGGKEVLYDMFGKASETHFDEAHRLLIFWFFWQRDRTRGLNFLTSEKIRDGLKNIWSFSETEINNLTQEFDSEGENNMEAYRLWKKLQVILENDKWSPTFVFPALSASLKMHWIQLDSLVGDNI